MTPFLIIAAMAASAAAPTPTGPLRLETRILPARPAAAAGTPTPPAGRMTPGDPLVVELGYRNTGASPISGLVLANPLPAGLAYRGADAPSPAPDLSVDGVRYGPLATLVVALPGGGTRPATLNDVTHVRWRLPAALAAGGAGRLAFRAVVR
jgi:hypothetical protein